MNDDLKNSPGFCVAPWMHLHVINDGRSFACCQTPLREENSFGNVKHECERCVSKQQNNLNTMRTGLNSKWYDETKDLIAKTAEDGTLSELQLKYWDFRFSNYCNLACTTCSPLFSTQWSKDFQKLHPGADKYSETQLIDLKEANVFWEDIEDNLETMKEIHFAGGEPLIMPEHWRILNMLDERKKYDIALRYSTNGTTLGQKKQNVMEMWKKFDYVHLSISIDGEGDAFEHIRYKGKWDQTLANLKTIRASRAVDFWFHPTVSILNIFRLTELHHELHINDLMPLESVHPLRGFHMENYWVDRFHINPLFTPEYYSITVLPELLKEQAADKITKYGKKLEADTGIPFSGWQNIIDFMYQHDNSHLWKQFKWKSKQIDDIRNTDVFELNPELRNG